jgi:hypothetical protein
MTRHGQGVNRDIKRPTFSDTTPNARESFVLYASSLKRMNLKLNEWRREGYEPSGGVCIAEGEFFQTLVKGR